MKLWKNQLCFKYSNIKSRFSYTLNQPLSRTYRANNSGMIWLRIDMSLIILCNAMLLLTIRAFCFNTYKVPSYFPTRSSTAFFSVIIDPPDLQSGSVAATIDKIGDCGGKDTKPSTKRSGGKLGNTKEFQRLDRIIANRGFCSRSETATYLQSGR